MARTHIGELSEYRAALSRKGEVAIGARARAERRKRYLLGLAGLALIGAAVLTHLLLRAPRHSGQRTTAVLVQCMDPKCKFQGMVEVPLGGAHFPVKCPRCKQQTCQKVWECREEDCRHQFVPRGTTDEVVCPECGSRRVGTATVARPQAARE
jgi:hypothetical protein